MNAIRKVNNINQKELENSVSESASWHADYRNTSYIYIGFLPVELIEIDIIRIFSQYGIPTHINLVKDKETKKSRGFCYLKYEDYRSCILAIDNFNGIQIYDKKIKVDHTYYYLKEGQQEDDFLIDYSKEIKSERENRDKRPMLLGESESQPSEKTPEEEEETQSSRGEQTKRAEADVVEDDEFKDPMEDYLRRKKSSSKKRKHKDSHDHSGRESLSKHKTARVTEENQLESSEGA